MTEQLAALKAFAAGLIGDQAGAWDVAGQLPIGEMRKLGERGLLCAEVPPRWAVWA